jgi:hypothetical protein
MRGGRMAGVGVCLAFLIVAVAVVVAGPPPAVPGDHDLWALDGSPTTSRWLVIHNLQEGRKTGVYHVEVLERATGDPAWRFTRLAAHLAVTEKALRASVRKPLTRGRVYPEQFDAAFAKWRDARKAGGGVVCDRTVLACLEPQ